MLKSWLPVIDGIGDFVSNDEMVLDFNGALNVVTNGSCRFAGSLHRARIGIGERDLSVFLPVQAAPRSLSYAQFLA